MSEWLFDTPIFRATMTPEMEREANLFRNGAKPRNESEEDTMAKKNDVKTIAENTNTESKEDTMTIEGIPMKYRKNGAAYYDRTTDVARHLAIREETKLGRIKGIEPVTCIPGETVGNITKDPAEVELLGKACKKFGWENGVCTVSKAGKYHGTPNPEYKGHGWFVRFKDAKTETSGTVAYPMEAFIWDTESGLPEFDTEKKAAADARKAKIAANKAAKQLREANKAAGIKTPRRKASRKPAAKKVETIANEPVPMAAPGADMAAMMNMLNAVMAQNAQLIAALAAKSE